MHIVSTSDLQLRADHQQVFGRQVSERLEFRNGNQSLEFQRNEQQLFASAAQREVAVSEPGISRQALQQYADSLPAAPSGVQSEAAEPFDFELDAEQLENLRMLLAALARLNDDFDHFATMFEQATKLPDAIAQGMARPAVAAPTTAGAVEGGGAQQPGLSYDYHVTQWEREQLNVAASGQVTTADGRTIDFRLDVDMERAHYSHESVSIRAGGVLRDPLVINYAGNAVGLTSQTMEFDLDANGTADTLAMLRQGSAYLALDKNGNGRIDDGRELFGALTGNGFAELAAYDDDGNGFIDSGDAIFKDLKLWIPSANGAGRLLSLEEAGIGALGLRHVDGGFDLVADGELQGQVRSTGLFLFEDGRVGSMQQIDLVM